MQPKVEHFVFVEGLEPFVYISAIITAFVFFYGIYLRVKTWLDDNDWKVLIRKPRFKNFLVYALGQKKVIKYGYEGTMHLLIMWGILLLLMTTIVRALDYDLGIRVLGTRFLVGNIYVFYKIVANIGGVFLIAGTVMAIARRSLGRSPRLAINTFADFLILFLLLTLGITGFVLDAIITAKARNGPWVYAADPVGVSLAPYFKDFGELYPTIWTFHMLLAMMSLALTPYTKLFHLVSAPITILFSDTYELYTPRTIMNVEKIVEEGGQLGVSKIRDFSWKRRLSFDACTQCGRCHAACPANTSGKPLSPMMFVLKLRDNAIRGYDGELVGTVVSEDEIWSCTTCLACVYECPVLIDQLGAILDVRRYLAMMEARLPDSAMQALYNIMNYGNPYGSNPEDRLEWLRAIGAPLAQEEEEYEILYWLGCSTSYDPRARKIAEATIKLFKKSGVKFAVLPEEKCCGEVARRLGDEFLFQTIARENIQMLSKYRFRKLVVNCPHGFQVFRKEYVDLGFRKEVAHHTQVLRELVERGLLKGGVKNGESVTYHDPCYLGRYNGEFEAPRLLIRLAGHELREMRRIREKSFCCGGGGGGAWMEIKAGERISKLRAAEARATRATILAVACPYCMAMLRAEVEGGEEEMVVKDVAELLAESMDSEQM